MFTWCSFIFSDYYSCCSFLQSKSSHKGSTRHRTPHIKASTLWMRWIIHLTRKKFWGWTNRLNRNSCDDNYDERVLIYINHEKSLSKICPRFTFCIKRKVKVVHNDQRLKGSVIWIRNTGCFSFVYMKFDNVKILIQTC